MNGLKPTFKNIWATVPVSLSALLCYFHSGRQFIMGYILYDKLFLLAGVIMRIKAVHSKFQILPFPHLH